MMAQEIATAVQEKVKLTVLVLDNQGFASIGGLSRAVGCDGFGTRYQRRSDSGELDGLPVRRRLHRQRRIDGRARGARASRADIEAALRDAWSRDGVSVIVVPVDRDKSVGGRESWWDVPVAEMSPLPEVRRARAEYEKARPQRTPSSSEAQHVHARRKRPLLMGRIWNSTGRVRPPRSLGCSTRCGATDYDGTELGDWGFLPTEPAPLRAELSTRRLELLGAFVPVALTDAAAHTAGVESALRVARLLVGGFRRPSARRALRRDGRPSLAHGTRGTHHASGRPGRQRVGHGCSRRTNAIAARGARTDRSAHGVSQSLRDVRRNARRDRRVDDAHRSGAARTVPGHRACRLRWRQSARRPSTSGTAGSGTCTSRTAIRRFVQRARQEKWDYPTSVRNGVFCELGKGEVDFPAVVDRLRASATTAGSSSNKTCCRRWGRRRRAPGGTAPYPAIAGSLRPLRDFRP